MIFRFRPAELGRHVHVEVYVKAAPEVATFAQLGGLRFARDEWQAFRQMLIRGGGADFLPPSPASPLGDLDLEVEYDE